ncbi:B-cell receptor CD22-like isoform X1 [Hippoglossus hippoglossus]|uniref:B-cell receptor CD22-like isoform X1 n=2 Tax=Hippoglossus hippoglossus TaxID=8267 RepID=UPI00148BB07C|nr:B-cell receptor CD22-like isoform X1 [Hippoglossus hippoglossus]XP_034468274.1 B-cell receptor CD22-like isoform X1 [Hippoglossus hippoglossus]
MESWMLMILVIMPGVWSGEWSVTFEDQCALRGGSVVMKCSYNYPRSQRVTQVDWSRALFTSGRGRLHHLSSLPSPPDFEYVGNRNGNCSLKINNVQPTDQGQYYFSFVTTLDRWTSKSHAYLYVKELTAVLKPSTVKEGDVVRLTCVSECPTPKTIVWFKDGQPVWKPEFSVRREDAGSYFCAVLEQETVRSNSVTLNVQYAPKRVTLSLSPPGDVVKGSSVTFNCSSDANPPVRDRGYSLYMDGQFISSGQEHTISDLQPRHSGLYHCQACNNVSWRGDDLMNSTDFHLDVLYGPMNMSILVDDQQFAEGSSVNLTCSSVANPEADNYTWYKRTDSPSSSSWLQVGWGQVLSLPSVEASHTGRYLCQTSNSVGEGNSTDLLVTMKTEDRGSQMHLIIAGVGVIVLVTLVVAHLLYWKKRTRVAKKRTAFGAKLSGEGLSSSATEDQLDTVYANIQTFPSSRPRNTDHKHYVPSSDEAELIYTTVAIKPRNSRAPQESRATIGESEDSVIYSTVVKSS